MGQAVSQRPEGAVQLDILIDAADSAGGHTATSRGAASHTTLDHVLLHPVKGRPEVGLVVGPAAGTQDAVSLNRGLVVPAQLQGRISEQGLLFWLEFDGLVGLDAGADLLDIVQNAERTLDHIVDHIAGVTHADVVADVASDQAVGANHAEEPGQQLVRGRAVMAVNQHDLRHFFTYSGLDAGGVTQTHHVLGELAAGLILDASLANLERLETFVAQAIKNIDGGDEGVTLTTGLVGSLSQHAWSVLGNLLVAQRSVRAERCLVCRTGILVHGLTRFHLFA